jgi:hypothetical protein
VNSVSRRNYALCVETSLKGALTGCVNLFKHEFYLNNAYKISSCVTEEYCLHQKTNPLMLSEEVKVVYC